MSLGGDVSPHAASALTHLRRLQQALTHNTLMVEAEEAAAARVARDAAHAQRRLDGLVALRARGLTVDAARRNRRRFEDACERELAVKYARLDATKAANAQLKIEIDACRRQRLDAFAEIVRLRECVESVGREMRKREEAIHTTIDARDAAKHTAQTLEADLRVMEADYTATLQKLACAMSDTATRAQWRRGVLKAAAAPSNDLMSRRPSIEEEGFLVPEEFNQIVFAPSAASTALWRRMRQRFRLFALQANVWKYRLAFARMCGHAGNIKMHDLPGIVQSCERERAAILSAIAVAQADVEVCNDHIAAAEGEEAALSEAVGSVAPADATVAVPKGALEAAEAELVSVRARLAEHTASLSMCVSAIMRLHGELVRSHPSWFTSPSSPAVVTEAQVQSCVGQIDAFVAAAVRTATRTHNKGSGSGVWLAKAPSIPTLHGDLTRIEALHEIDRLSGTPRRATTLISMADVENLNASLATTRPGSSSGGRRLSVVASGAAISSRRATIGSKSFYGTLGATAARPSSAASARSRFSATHRKLTTPLGKTML